MPKSMKSTKSTRKSRKVTETPVKEPVKPVVEPVKPVVEQVVEPVVEKVVEDVEKPVDIKPKAKRASRAPSKYNMYVKQMMSSKEITSLPARERMKMIGKMWKEEKEKVNDVI